MAGDDLGLAVPVDRGPLGPGDLLLELLDEAGIVVERDQLAVEKAAKHLGSFDTHLQVRIVESRLGFSSESRKKVRLTSSCTSKRASLTMSTTSLFSSAISSLQKSMKLVNMIVWRKSRQEALVFQEDDPLVVLTRSTSGDSRWGGSSVLPWIRFTIRLELTTARNY